MSLPPEHLLDRLATSYVSAIAATASANLYKGDLDYGVDGTVSRVVKAKRKNAPGFKYVSDGFIVEYQLKATTGALLREDHVAYDLDARAYDMIATRSERAVPLFLFLVCFGSEQTDWMHIDPQQLTLRASGYWWRTKAPATANSTSVRIEVPRVNALSGLAVAALLQGAQDLVINVGR
jgi:hypothetical protein